MQRTKTETRQGKRDYGRESFGADAKGTFRRFEVIGVGTFGEVINDAMTFVGLNSEEAHLIDVGTIRSHVYKGSINGY
jgi:hypothetical protein